SPYCAGHGPIPYFRVAPDELVRSGAWALRDRMQGGFERLVVPISGSVTDDRLLSLLPELLGKEGGTGTFLFGVEFPQSMPLDAELPAEVGGGERALKYAEKVARP